MPGPVLRRRGMVDFQDGVYSIPEFECTTVEERLQLIGLCESKIRSVFTKALRLLGRIDASPAGYISGTLRYEILKRATFRCELCGISADIRALEADHIVPRNQGGTDDPSNLQALCYKCNAMKRDRDDTDFRGLAAAYQHREIDCEFCQMEQARVVAENELFFGVRDAYPVTEGHTLLLPKRHVASPHALFQPELNAMWYISSGSCVLSFRPEDRAISGFNLGSNDGLSAGQSIMHAHFHLIPRRDGDVERPRGGVRGVIPQRQDY